MFTDGVTRRQRRHVWFLPCHRTDYVYFLDNFVCSISCFKVNVSFMYETSKCIIFVLDNKKDV